MQAYTPRELEAIEYAAEAGKLAGDRYPDEVQGAMYETMVQFAHFGLEVHQTNWDEHPSKGIITEADYFRSMGKLSIGISGALYKKIPLSYTALRGKTIPAPAAPKKMEARRGRGRPKINEAFWQGETMDEPPERSGMISDWMAEVVVYFEGRPLSNRDIAKVVYRNYDALPGRHIDPRVRGTMLKGNAEPRINAKGYELKSEVINKAVYYMAVPPEDEWVFDLSKRPTTEELKEIAILIRQREFEFQKKLAEEAEARARERKERKENRYKLQLEKVQQVAFSKDAGQLTEFGRQVMSATARGLSLAQAAEEINLHRKEAGLPLRNEHQIAIARAEIKKALGLPGMPEVVEYFYPEKVQELSGPWNVNRARVLGKYERKRKIKMTESSTIRHRKPGQVKTNLEDVPRSDKMFASAMLEDILPNSRREATSKNTVKKGIQNNPKKLPRKKIEKDFEAMEAAAEQEGEELELRLRAGIVAMDKSLPLHPAQKKVLEAVASGISIERVAATINVPEDKIVNLIIEGYGRMVELKKAHAEAAA